jgi:MFS family permease
MMAFGATQVVLALFFAELGLSDTRIGLFFTMTLFGDVFLGIGLTLIADRVGRRKVLFGGSAMMILSGLIFAWFENFWILLLAAIVGMLDRDKKCMPGS